MLVYQSVWLIYVHGLFNDISWFIILSMADLDQADTPLANFTGWDQSPFFAILDESDIKRNQLLGYAGQCFNMF